jgi:hypothetical protein
VTAYTAALNSQLKQSSRDRRSALGAVAAAVALIFVVGVVPTPNASKRAMPAVANPQVAALMSDYDLSNREAAERIARQDSIADLATYLATEFPAAYGGLWIDHAHGGAVMAAVTRAGIGVDSARDFGLGAEVREVIVDRSLRDLDQISGEIYRMVGAAYPHAERRLATSIDVKRNSVIVEIGATESVSRATQQHRLVRRIKRIYGPAAVVTQGQRIRTYDDACVDTNCPPPLRGGIQIRGEIACSIGFVVTTSSGAPAVTTAGHCPPPTSTLYTHHGTTIGSTLAVVDSGDVDARSISVDDAAYWSPANWVLHQGFGSFPPNETFPITSRAVKTEIVLGLYLCRTGFRTNTQCGEVNNLRAFRTGNRRLFGIRACAASGDSGGPVYDYSSGRAYGQHMASSATGCTETETSFFSPIDSIEAALGVTVRTE